jgi:predicted RNase H-like HicB family nuclease
MRYKIALQRTEEGYAVSVPGLPGCWSQGATEAEALENIRDAIREYLAARDDLLGGAEIREVEVSAGRPQLHGRCRQFILMVLELPQGGRECPRSWPSRLSMSVG